MMEILATEPGILLALVPLIRSTRFLVIELLPLVSDRVNERAVRLIKAKNQQSE